MSTIINLYGGPGTGKSTSAAYLYASLKHQGVNAELVREYAKDWAWEGRPIRPFDQIYLTSKQSRRESSLYGKADVIVTDSPVLLGLYYTRKYFSPVIVAGIAGLVQSFYQQATDEGHRHIHVLLGRTKPYATEGRYESESDAKAADAGIRALLDELLPNYLVSGTSTAELTILMKGLNL